MTRSEFLARFTIQHASVERAVRLADLLEAHEGFDGWDDNEDSPELERLLLAIGALLEAHRAGAGIHLGDVEDAYAPWAEDAALIRADLEDTDA